MAHIDLLEPEARAHGTAARDDTDVDANSNLKSGPCGQMTSGRTDRVATYAPGQRITVRVREENAHVSYLRVSLDLDGEDFPLRTQFPAGPETQELAEAAEAALGADGLLAVVREDNDTLGFVHEIDVTLPDATCDSCTLQVLQFMYDDPAAPYYFQCADPVIAEAGSADAGGVPERRRWRLGCTGSERVFRHAGRDRAQRARATAALRRWPMAREQAERRATAALRRPRRIRPRAVNPSSAMTPKTAEAAAFPAARRARQARQASRSWRSRSVSLAAAAERVTARGLDEGSGGPLEQALGLAERGHIRFTTQKVPVHAAIVGVRPGATRPVQTHRSTHTTIVVYWWYEGQDQCELVREACLLELDELAGKGANRSALIEEAVVEYIERRRRKARGGKDRQIIADNAKSLERDVLETLEFQVPE